MTKDQLPEKLRNIPGLEIADGTKRTVMLKDSQVDELAKIFTDLRSREDKGA